jgi:hypothetical protein
MILFQKRRHKHEKNAIAVMASYYWNNPTGSYKCAE